ncbi:MAG: hypothetical protein U5K33_00150 [Halofilum sp. (in: g-proteobacteria)]|nr:hypothetical protein [Halofilum sp. (in: g-proteobacteria)]
MKARRWMAGLVTVAALFGAAPAMAEATEVVVRVISKDAKFVGTSMGGVRVVLGDAETGEILATGTTSGGTGNTGKIMHTDGGRRQVMADDSAAAFRATLDLERPRLVEVEAYGPLAQPQAAHRVTATQWLVPGRDVAAGNGWVLELPGFVVDILDPPAHRKLGERPDEVPVRANVTMMCGCPIEPGGLWDADRYEVAAIVTRNGERVDEVALEYAGETSQFAGAIPVNGPGVYDIAVFAHDPHNGNTGVDRTTFIVN